MVLVKIIKVMIVSHVFDIRLGFPLAVKVNAIIHDKLKRKNYDFLLFTYKIYLDLIRQET